MIELLILFNLNNKVLTMYGISREINSSFAVLTTPSYGTIQPALTRLLKSGFVKKQKTLSEGGRPSCYYSITPDGVNELKRLLITPPQDNPVQFLTNARIRLACAEVLENDAQLSMLARLKNKAESILIDAQNIMKSQELTFYTKMVFDNLICEYKNFISLLEGMENACTH